MKIYVYVLNKHGRPLMPTSPAKARRLLKAGKAKVVRRSPFTVQLIYGSSGYTQPVTLGVDAGYKHVGVSAVSETKELFSSEVELRTNISRLLSKRRMYRRLKRNKLWYRPPRFNNRKKVGGWLAPSVQHKLDSHVKIVKFVSSILPITKVIVETAAFDIQKIKNPDISGREYQNGEQKGFWNVREYVLYRDNHTCQLCKGKNRIFEVHHIVPRSKGGTDKPDNLITLCSRCHKKVHEKGMVLKPVTTFKPETFMSIIRWKLLNTLHDLGFNVSNTYGYLTKNKRIELGLDKSHATDAFCIAGGERQERTNTLKGTFTRRNNRCLQINRKGYKSSIRRQRYKLQPNDLVRYGEDVYRVTGVHSYGTWAKLKDKLGNIFNVSAKRLEFLVYGKGLQFG